MTRSCTACTSCPSPGEPSAPGAPVAPRRASERPEHPSREGHTAHVQDHCRIRSRHRPGAGRRPRFGQEGFRVALVARTQPKLEALRAELEREGIEADTFTQDLADHSALAGTVAAINKRFGRIDVTEYSPAGITERPVATLDLDLDGLQPQLDVRLLAPIRLVNLVLPGMLERGDGALLFGLGAAGTNPLSFMSNVGIAFAGLRNYLKTLNESLAPKGVYAGGLTIGALIELSEAQRQFDQRPTSAQSVGFQPERVWPKDLADTFWDMYVKRDRFEDSVGTY